MAKRPLLRNLEGRKGTEGLITDSYVKIPDGYAKLWHQNVQEDIAYDLQSLSTSVTIISQNAMC